MNFGICCQQLREMCTAVLSPTGGMIYAAYDCNFPVIIIEYRMIGSWYKPVRAHRLDMCCNANCMEVG